MPFDGIVINSLVSELKEKLVEGRIDKIHQPEKDELIIHIRGFKTNYKLLISADSRLGHITLTDAKKVNPTTPPMFCMLLRKHIAGSRIIDITQMEMERIIAISVEGRNELGDTVVKDLIIETMGKHSNIVLIDKSTGKIIDSVKRIPFGTSRSRQLLPGLTYEAPPNFKTNLLTTSYEDFISALEDYQNNTSDEKIHKFIYMTYQGVSPIIGKELCLNANIDKNLQLSLLKPVDKEKLWHQLVQLRNQIKDQNFAPIVALDSQGISKDFSCFDLNVYSQSEDFEVLRPSSTTDAINAFFAKRDINNRLMQRSQNLRKTVNAKVDKLSKKIKNLKGDLHFAENADEDKIKGELIIANIYVITKGDSSAKLTNYYDPEAKEIEIPLDIRLSPSDNAQKYFKKYNKLKTAQIKVQEQLEIAELEIAYLENVLVNIEISSDNKNIEEIQQELIQEGYLKKKYLKKAKKAVKSKPLKYKSSDGFDILVGKNNTQNDELTLKTASNADIWLHTKIIPGSHVIIRTQGNEVPDQTIREAAMIAAYHSKARGSSQVPIDYTEVRNVKKPNGAKPGMVIYETNSTVYVTPEEAEVEKLKATN